MAEPHVPMPSRIDVMLAVREDGSREGLPVCRLRMTDPAGEVRELDLSEEVLITLVADGVLALRQLHYGRASVPAPWT